MSEFCPNCESHLSGCRCTDSRPPCSKSEAKRLAVQGKGEWSSVGIRVPIAQWEAMRAVAEATREWAAARDEVEAYVVSEGERKNASSAPYVRLLRAEEKAREALSALDATPQDGKGREG